jgi:hypothetical protein
MSMNRRAIALLCAILGWQTVAPGEIGPIWLTHKTNTPSKLCVNWLTTEAANSVVRFGPTSEVNESVRTEDLVTLHHLEIPFGEGEGELHYLVESGGERSVVAAVKRYGGAALRVAVVADWQGRPDLSTLVRDEPHVLLIAGDQVSSLHETCGPGVKDCVKPFAKLVDQYRTLFRSVPVMPALGNHDREIRPRGPTPPAEPVYDIDATAWRSFYPLPDEGWKWHFDVPGFDLRLIALDLQHTQDLGTTWQTGHDYRADTPQFSWYRDLIAQRDRSFVITLINERNATMRGYEKGQWHRMFRQGSAVVSGFGYFAERAEADGFPYFNTALGAGAKYPDPKSKFFANEASYVLLSFQRDVPRIRVEIKNLKGDILDQSEWPAGAK